MPTAKAQMSARKNYYRAVSLSLSVGLSLSLVGLFGKLLAPLASLNVILLMRFFVPGVLIFCFIMLTRRQWGARCVCVRIYLVLCSLSYRNIVFFT